MLVTSFRQMGSETEKAEEEEEEEEEQEKRRMKEGDPSQAGTSIHLSLPPNHRNWSVASPSTTHNAFHTRMGLDHQTVGQK